MDQEQTPKEPEEKKIPKFRGLYEHVHISVKALDIIIGVCIAVIVLVLAFDLSTNPGFTVTFDSKGGSDVAAQQVNYGELVKADTPPVREGYRFTGWYRDPACQELWGLTVDAVSGDMTLYAGWERQ